MKRLVALFATTMVMMMAISTPVFAASASMTLSVSSGSVVKGNYVYVYVRENSGSEPVNAAQANFSYSSSLVQYIGISNSAAFSIVAQNSGGGGSVSIGRGALPAVSGSQLIATVTFKALADSGTANFSFTGGSSVISANSNANIAGSESGSSVLLVAPAPPAPKDTTPPTITAVSVKAVTAESATITWTTSEPATSEVDYGLTTNYGLSATAGGLTTAHSVVLDSALLTGGTTYHFMIKTADQAGNIATSSDKTFTTTGTTVTILVTDAATNHPVAGAQASWNGRSATTDAQGHATLINLPSGTTTIVVRVGPTVTAATVAIGAPSGSPQLVALKVKLAAATWPWWTEALAGSIICVLITGASYAFGKGLLRWPHRRQRYQSFSRGS